MGISPSFQSVSGGSGKLAHFGGRGFRMNAEAVVDQSFTAGRTDGDDERAA
jgi:hypothetical protein